MSTSKAEGPEGSRDDLHPDPGNANRGTERGRAMVSRSLKECGAGRSIVVDRDGSVIAGNKTLEAARKLGLAVRVVETQGDELLVVRRTDLKLGEDERARRLAYLDNRSGELGLEWDAEQLLADLTAGVDLSGIFAGAELDQLLGGLARPGMSDPDFIPELPAEPISKVGDLYTLGNHRLLVGDSTNPDDVKRLMRGERATLMFTDPPYLVGYTGGEHPSASPASKHKWDKDWDSALSTKDKRWDDYVDHDTSVKFYVDFLRAALDHALIASVPVYQCHASMRTDIVLQAWREVGLLPHQCLVWKKSRPVLTHAHYMWSHENIMYGWPQGHMPSSKPPADAKTVWEIESKIEDGAGSVHPTMKPVELVRRPIGYHTVPGGLIYEPFAGSGTAIVAAEQLGRVCYALELSPAFVDVACERYRLFTGIEPMLEVRDE